MPPSTWVSWRSLDSPQHNRSDRVGETGSLGPTVSPRDANEAVGQGGRGSGDGPARR